MGVIMIVVVLTGMGVTFRHIYWIGCHIPTHILDRVSHSDTYIGSGVTFRHTNSLGMGSMRGPLVMILFISNCH